MKLAMFTTIAAFAALAPCCLAQLRIGGSAQSTWPGSLVLPQAGAPLSAEFRELGAAQGSPAPQARTVFRDNLGRLHVEPYLDGRMRLIQLTDPVAGLMFVLDTAKKVAYRTPFPKIAPSEQPRFVGFLPKQATGAESLGKRTIGNIECEGLRFTILGSSPVDEEVEERWFSSNLGIIGLVKRSRGEMERSVELRTLARTDPDPQFFRVPDGYRIVELDQ